MLKKRIVITGGGGKLASEIYKKNSIHDIILAHKSDLDITKLNVVDNYIKEKKPDIIIHTAALTKPMKQHDENIDLSIDINIIGTSNVVKICSKYNIKIIYISTDYVYPFNSENVTEKNCLLPFNNYGWSKLGGECAVQMYKKSLIIRLSFMDNPFPFDKAYKNIIRNMFYIDECASAILKIIDKYGIINIGTKDSISIFELAKKTNKNINSIDNYDKNLPKIMTLDVTKYNKNK